MKELYEELYRSCAGISGFETDAHFVAMDGVYYRENEKRFMLIGWAPNCWGSLLTISPEAFGADAARQFNDHHRFKWIESIDGVQYSSDDRQFPLAKRYCVSGRHYWTHARAIWEKLPGETKDCYIWQENIAWSNLYKISPNNSNNPNPDEASKKRQLEACRKILKYELDAYAPTHILIFSGYDWFAPFADLFDDVVDRHVRNISKGLNKNDVYVEGTAKYGNASVVISCRPEYRSKEPFIADIVDAFIKETSDAI